VPDEPPPLPGRGEPARIVCAGRIERFKGQDVLVQAFERVARKHPRARLVLIGPDQWSRKQRFSELVDQIAPDPEVRARIELTGPQPLATTQDQIGRAMIAVVPSPGFESFSFSTLEAMAAGRPTVCSRMGAMPELLDYGRCGRIVPPGDPGSLAEELDYLLSDRSASKKLGQHAHERAKTLYDTSAVLPSFVDAYERARDEAASRVTWRQHAAGRPGEFGALFDLMAAH
jgi:glycosyltransferase involved in cell wall biosynthesis